MSCTTEAKEPIQEKMAKEVIQQTINFVKETLAGAEAGHDWFHIERVWKTAKHINATEKSDDLTIELAALLHDIADSKFNGGDEDIGPKKATDFLASISVNAEIIEHVKQIIKNISFKNSFDNTVFSSKELQVVQDADRLDALGAIGIARAFTYGGFKNRLLYDPKVKPKFNHDKESYKNTSAPTINHFYEKLLLLKDLMNTETGKKMAEKRHQFMERYLEQFFAEWEGVK